MRWLVALCLTAGLAQAECRLALTLGLDISGSVDAQEYRLQLDGLAEALGSEAVQAAIFAMPGTWIDLSVFEWSGPNDFRLTVPVTPVERPKDLDAVRDRLAVWARWSSISASCSGVRGMARPCGCGNRLWAICRGAGRSATALRRGVRR